MFVWILKILVVEEVAETLKVLEDSRLGGRGEGGHGGFGVGRGGGKCGGFRGSR